MSKILAVIPARYGSSRFPAKVLAPLHGKPLVQWVYERTCLAESVDEVVVATDDLRVKEALENAGCHVVMTREDHPSGTDRVAEVAESRDVDGVINVQGDEPMIDPGLIDSMAEMILAGTCDMSTAATPILSEAEFMDPGVVKVVLNASDDALYFSRSPIPHNRDGVWSADEPGLRHLGIYGYRKDFLMSLVQNPVSPLENLEKLEQLRALHHGGVIKVAVTNERGVGVDSPDDLLKAEALMVELGII